jgi:MEDS: MEthanogen/methylotroph, DcmR Sensory domain
VFARGVYWKLMQCARRQTLFRSEVASLHSTNVETERNDMGSQSVNKIGSRSRKSAAIRFGRERQARISLMDAVRHQCMIYEGPPAKHLPGLASVIVEKLKANYRCVYFNSPPMIAGIRSYLAATGLSVAAEIRRGALVLSSDQDHLLEGRFDIDRMLELIEATVVQALGDGYQGLWASGDMTWEFGGENDLEKLRKYEQGLEELFRRNPTLQCICQYHAEMLPLGAVKEALYAHRSVYINEWLSRINPYYESAGLLARQEILSGQSRDLFARPQTQMD